MSSTVISPAIGMKAPVKTSSTAVTTPMVEVPATAASPATSTARTRILLVDDHPLMRKGIKAWIEQFRRVESCGEADSAPRALELAGKLTPDLAIVDITLKSTNGIELTKGLRAQVPTMKVLIVSMHDEEIYAERALRAGAMGYLMKHEAGEKIIGAIEKVMAGEIHLSDRIKGKMLRRFVHHRADALVSPMEKLSDREMEVFQLLGNGYGTREIARLLNLS